MQTSQQQSCKRTLLARRAILHTMEIDEQRAAIRDLVQLMMERTGLDSTGLARLAGLAPSTVTRFLNSPVKHLLTARTLAKLSEASGVAVPVGSPLSGAAEHELLAAFRSADDQGREMMLRLARSLRQDAESASQRPGQPSAPEHPPPRPTRGGSGRENPVSAGCECSDCDVVRLPPRQAAEPERR